MSEKKFDIAIVGGGMVGLSLATALRTSSLRIALIDASSDDANDPRLIALNENSICFFKNCGVWDDLQGFAEAIKEVHISDRGHFGKVRLRAHDVALQELGFVVPSKNINAVLYQHLQTSANISLFRPYQLNKLTLAAGKTFLSLQPETEISASLVIGADGIESTVRREMNIEVETVEYEQSALVTVTELSRSHHNIAYERFHSQGAIAMLPLQGNRCATILTDAKQHIDELKQLDDTAFKDYLQQHFGYQLGRLQNKNPRYVFPLRMQKAKEHFKHSVLLIGNAAHNLHPIAAQGLNLAIAEIAKLTEVLLAQKNNLHAVPLEEYFSWQKKQEAASVQFSHALPSIFASQFPVTKVARQLGLIGLNLCPPLKKRFTLKAMGRNQTVPDLLLR